MAFTVDPNRFRFGSELGAGVAGKRVLITGAGKDGGLGQAFALAAGLNGAAAVGVHFHRSYDDGFDLVEALQSAGVAAFPVQADVTNMGDLWATRSYVIEQFGGLPPNLIICNSGLTEKGYSFGPGPARGGQRVDGAATARVRQHFIDNLEESAPRPRHQDRRLPGHDPSVGRRGRLPRGVAADRLHLVAPGHRPGRQRAGLRHLQLGRAAVAEGARRSTSASRRAW